MWHQSVVKNGEWFVPEQYRDWPTYAKFYKGSESMAKAMGALGYGTVRIDVQLGPNEFGVLELYNVLHCPKMEYNIVGGPETPNVGNFKSLMDSQEIDIEDKKGNQIARFRPYKNVYILNAVAPPAGCVFRPSLTTKDKSFTLPLHILQTPGEFFRIIVSEETPYRHELNIAPASLTWTESETQWVARVWRSMKKFFEAYGWDENVYRDEANARRLVRLIRMAEYEYEQRLSTPNAETEYEMAQNYDYADGRA